jgi:sodium/hydrogen antiporter
MDSGREELEGSRIQWSFWAHGHWSVFILLSIVFRTLIKLLTGLACFAGAVFISTLAIGQLPRAEGVPQNDAEWVAETIQPIVAFMVVVSIVIHGLSIPFFSLGRRVHTVTRTWSRQPSLPDWAMQTRPVVRGEDIVINRDPDSAEKGELPPTDIKEKDDKASGAPGVERRKSESTSETPVGTPVNEKAEAEHDAQRDATGENNNSSPDDEIEVVEWKEGPHKVIERHQPGEEVNYSLFCYLLALTFFPLG